jgi:hypothetical protein
MFLLVFFTPLLQFNIFDACEMCYSVLLHVIHVSSVKFSFRFNTRRSHITLKVSTLCCLTPLPASRLSMAVGSAKGSVHGNKSHAGSRARRDVTPGRYVSF